MYKRQGDRVELAHPKTGEKSILTVKSLQAIHHRELPRIEGWEFPGHLWELVYTCLLDTSRDESAGFASAEAHPFWNSLGGRITCLPRCS